MSQVTGSFSVSVKPGGSSTPVTIEPSSGNLPDEQEGVTVDDKVATVSGGTPPYNYTFAGQPDGITFAETDNGDGSFDIRAQGMPLAGDAAKSPYTVTVTVNDSASPSARATRQLSVR